MHERVFTKHRGCLFIRGDAMAALYGSPAGTALNENSWLVRLNGSDNHRDGGHFFIVKGSLSDAKIYAKNHSYKSGINNHDYFHTPIRKYMKLDILHTINFGPDTKPLNVIRLKIDKGKIRVKLFQLIQAGRGENIEAALLKGVLGKKKNIYLNAK